MRLPAVRCAAKDSPCFQSTPLRLGGVIGPPTEFLIQPFHHFPDIQPFHVPAGLDTDRFGHAPDALPRGTGSY
ncbi:MAG TPA: hypothetical protein VMR02_21435, partial [Terracidiphilus sp.]|nr:hypothetical protein [Terracidiphilus sp.]